MWLMVIGVILFGGFIIFSMVSSGAPLIIVYILIGCFIFAAAATAFMVSILTSKSSRWQSEKGNPSKKDYFTGSLLLLLALFLGYGYLPRSVAETTKWHVLGLCVALLFFMLGILWFRKKPLPDKFSSTMAKVGNIPTPSIKRFILIILAIVIFGIPLVTGLVKAAIAFFAK